MVPENSDCRLIEWELTSLLSFSPTRVFAALFTALLASFRSRAALQILILALRHQLTVLQRSVKRPKLTAADRGLWAWLSNYWADWRSTLASSSRRLSSAGTAKASGSSGRGKVCHGQPGRPPISKETRDLIRKMSRDNLLWGAPRIHGELLKLGIDIGDSTAVARGFPL